METENQTEETQVEASQLNAAAGNEAESATTDTLSLEEINALTGKEYKDKETALKSIKDMSSMAGKAADLEGKLKAAQASSAQTPDDVVKALQDQLNQTQAEVFFSNNPDHKENRELLEQLAKANGVSVQEAINLDVYKNVVEKVVDKSNRTVANSNKRVANSGKSEEFDARGKTADELAEFVTNTYFKS